MSRHLTVSMTFAVAAALLGSTGCGQDVPPSSEFGSADSGAGGDLGSLSDTTVGDAGSDDVGTTFVGPATDAGVADASGGAKDAGAPAKDTAASQDAGGSPTCYEALNCLLEKKEWTPSKPPPEDGACMKGMVESETKQADELVACVHTECKTQFEAWESGGPTELNALYGCMIEKCALPLAVCVGGEGDKKCGEAVKCLQACPPLDKTCTVPCLRPTTDYESEKTGKILACVLKKCPLDTLATCKPDSGCIVHCMSFIGG